MNGQQDAPGAALPSWLAGLIVFAASGAVLVLEIVAIRLLAPYIGVTLQTNSAVIGMALAAIALGALVGGRLADVVNPRRLLAPALMVGGVLSMLTLPAVRIAGEASRGTDAGGVLLVAGIAIFAPAAVLSAVSPLVIKLQLRDLAATGSVVGRLSGIATAGAIAATFVTGFVLVAALPSTTIVLSLGMGLVIGGAALQLALHLRRPATRGADGGAAGVAGIAVAGLIAAGLVSVAPVACDVETAYHCARVVQDPIRPSGRTLQLDNLRHSYVDLNDPTHLEFAYIQAIASAADVFRPPAEPVRALHVGGGGFTMPRYLAATRPGSSSLVLEIDRGVVELDHQRLGLRIGPELRVRIGDGRTGVRAQSPGTFDLVVGDAFGGVAVPFHLATREAAAEVRRTLRPGGLYALNVIDYPPSALVRAEIATISAEFEHVAVVAAPEFLDGRSGGNFVLLASDAPLPLPALSRRLAERNRNLTLATRERLTAFVAGAQPLTDDYAPVDQLLGTAG